MSFFAGQRLTAAALNSAFSNTTQLIQKQTLTGSFPSVSFGSIPQTFTNLRLVIAAKSDGTGVSGYDNATMTFNGVTSANYNWNSYWITQGGSTVSVAGTNAVTSMQCAEIWNSHNATTGRGMATIDIPNYSDTTNFKGFTGVSSATDGGTAGIFQSYTGMLNSGTSAVTSLTINMGTGNFILHSTFSLYGS